MGHGQTVRLELQLQGRYDSVGQLRFFLVLKIWLAVWAALIVGGIVYNLVT